MKTVYACQGSHLALSCPPEHQIRVVRTIFMSHIIKNHRRDLFFVIGFKKITLGALTSPNLLGQHCLSSPVLMVSIMKKDRTKLNILSTLFFQGSRQLRPLLRRDLQRQGDHGLERQLHGAEEPQDYAGQVGRVILQWKWINTAFWTVGL